MYVYVYISIYKCTHFAFKYVCFKEARSLAEKIIALHMTTFTGSRQCITVYIYVCMFVYELPRQQSVDVNVRMQPAGCVVKCVTFC